MINQSIKLDSKLLGLLHSDSANSISTLGFFSNYELESFDIENQCAIAFGKSDHYWAHLIGSSISDIEKLLKKHNQKTTYYYSVKDWMIPLILEHGTLDWKMTTNRFVFNPDQLIAPSKLNIQPLDSNWASFIYEHSIYQSIVSIGYIEDRLMNDLSAAIFYKDQPIAWALTHDDGALGFLHVLDKWRNKGFAYEIMKEMLIQRKNQNILAFGNVVPGNIASENLLHKLGFSWDCKVSWLKLKD